jgi:hypothetical protein
MKVTKVWYITREDGTEYSKTFFDKTNSFATLEKNATSFNFSTPTGRKVSQSVIDKAIKAIDNYYQ